MRVDSVLMYPEYYLSVPRHIPKYSQRQVKNLFLMRQQMIRIIYLKNIYALTQHQ